MGSVFQPIKICSRCRSGIAKTLKTAARARSYATTPLFPSRPFRLAIIGSGPAGFYAASRVMREHNQTVVDMYEQLPIPFGLVRFGVAPDHPEVKNCQDRFEEIASLPNFNFIGNVKIGEELLIHQLRPHYDAMLFAYGASKDRRLGIPGEDLAGVLSAREFVAWYNGLPEFADLSPPLQGHGTEAVVIGQGNVALDVARMLLADVDELRHTDTPEAVLEALTRNDFKTVRIVGRRGPCQAAFTIKELRELSGTNKRLEPVPSHLFPLDPKVLARPRQRIAALLQAPKNNPPSAERSTELCFFLSPKSLQADPSGSRIASAAFSHTRVPSSGTDSSQFSPDARVEADHAAPPATLNAGILFRSIGYKAEALPSLREAGIPFDDNTGTIPNIQGRALRPELLDSASTDAQHSRNAVEMQQQQQQQQHVGSRFVPGIYITGWVKRGPTGVIATTMTDAFETADAIIADIRAQQGASVSASTVAHTIDFLDADCDREGWAAVRKQLPAGARPVSWRDWLAIDAVEKRRGQALGKPREKITSVSEMLRVLDG